MDKNRSDKLLKSIAVALLLLCLYASMEFASVLFGYTNAIHDVLAQQNGLPKIVYLHMFFSSIMYLIVIIGFLYSAFTLSKKKRKGRIAGLTITIISTAVLSITCIIRQEIDFFNFLYFIISAYIVFFISFLSMGKHKLDFD